MADSTSVRVPHNVPFANDDIDAMYWIHNPGQPGQIIDAISCTVYPAIEYQSLDGIGGSFSEVASDYLATLPEDLRHQAVGTLFNPDEGGFTYCRMPMGASDFGRDAYSYSEVANDFAMEHFSIDRDRSGMLRFIKEAATWQPDLQIHASPWSPPAWLKTNQSMLRGGKLIDSPEHYAAYAQYFVKFIQAYQAEGINIDRVCQQNEPDVPTPYPSCEFLPDQMVPWTVDYLAPALQEAKLETKIWAGTFRMVGGLQSHECLASEAFRSVIEGVGFQYSFTNNIRDLQRLYPEIKVMHTESVCHEGANSWTQAAMLFEDIIDYLSAGCTTYTYWNMVLDQLGFSSWYWRQNSLLKVDTEKGTVTEMPDLAVMKLFSRHIVPGSKRVEAFSFQRGCLAIKKPSGEVVLFIANHKPQSVPLRLTGPRGTETHELAPQSMHAIVIDG